MKNENRDEYVVVENYDKKIEGGNESTVSLAEIQKTAKKQARRKKAMTSGIIITLGIFAAYLLTDFKPFALIGAFGFMVVGLIKFIYDKQAKKDGTFEPSFWEKR